MIRLGFYICFGFDKVLVSFTEKLSKFELIDPFGVLIEEALKVTGYTLSRLE